MMDRWNDGGWGSGQWIAMGLMMVAFWTAVAVVVVVWLRSARRNGHQATATLHHDAERALGERFARGEIDEEEFTRRRDVLRR